MKYKKKFTVNWTQHLCRNHPGAENFIDNIFCIFYFEVIMHLKFGEVVLIKKKKGLSTLKHGRQFEERIFNKFLNKVFSAILDKLIIVTRIKINRQACVSFTILSSDGPIKMLKRPNKKLNSSDRIWTIQFPNTRLIYDREIERSR